MISQTFLASILALGLFDTVQAIRTAIQANAICNRYQAGYVAVMKPDGSDWGGCVPPPQQSESICFDEEYTDPKTGAKGCCPDGKPNSYDPISLNGKCCPTGSPFSYDPRYDIGDCCGTGIAFTCSCGGGTGVQQLGAPDTCPGLGADGAQKRMVGSTVWKFYCGRYVIAAQGLVKPSYKVNGGLQQCLADCAAEPSCQSIYYGFGNSLGANRVTECSLVGGVEAFPSGLNQDFIAAIPEPLRPVVPIPLSSTDTCPGLSSDGTKSRQLGGTTYKFYCGKWVSAPEGLVKPSYKVAGGLQQCLADCNATPSCQSVYYGFGNALGANRVTECNLVGGTQPIPQGVNQDFLAAIQDPPKPVVAIPMSATDNCPALGADGSKTRQEGAITYKFWCGKWVVSPAGNVRPPYKVTGGLQHCLQDCNAELRCKSVYYGFADALRANRVGECNLVGDTEVVPTGSNVDFVAAIPTSPK